jgi:hypothetical protein
MTRTPVLVVTAAIVGGALFVVGFLEYVASFEAITVDGWSVFPTVVLELVVESVFFAVGVFLALRFFAPIRSDFEWRKVVIRGLIASVAGAIAIAVGMTIAGFIGSVGPGLHPFGYAFTPVLEISPFANWAYQTAQTAVRPFLENIPLVVLACVFLKLWLAAHPTTVETKDGASLSA